MNCIEYGNKFILDDCVDLWEKIFCDERNYIKKFYSSFNTDGSVFTAYDGGALCGMVNRVPVKHGDYRGGYIYAACTREEYRGRGIFKNLMKLSEAGMDFMALIPASDELYGVYRKLGYDKTARSVFPFSIDAVILKTELFKPFDGCFDNLYKIYLDCVPNNEFIKTKEIFFLALTGFNVLYTFDGRGFAVYANFDKYTIKIYEMYCKNAVIYDIICFNNKKEHESGVYKILRQPGSELFSEMKLNLFMEY